MVKSIINVRRSSICWRQSEGTDGGRQKTRNHGYDVIVNGELFTVTPITLANLSRYLKLKSTGAGRYQLLSRWWDACKQLGLKTSLRKVRTLWHCSRLRAWRFTYD